MVEVHNLHRIGKVFSHQLPDPKGSISQNDNLRGRVEPLLACQSIEQFSKASTGAAASDIAHAAFFGCIDEDLWCQFRTLSSTFSLKNSTYFHSSINIAFSMLPSLFHWDTPTAHTS